MRGLSLERDTAPGVHRIEDAYTNWYLVEGTGRELIAVDAGVRSSWSSLEAALGELGRGAGDLAAVVLTHAHFDHVGFAERARRELGIDVWVHERDAPLTRHPWRYEHERSRIPYLAKPRALPIMAALAADRAFFPTPITSVRTFTNGTLPVAGEAIAIPTPGHTHGHCSLHLPERDALIAGDAIVNLDPYTGARGPRLVARAATADVDSNLASLDAIAATGARHVLTGHGDPLHDGAEAVAARAARAGAA